MPGNESHKNHQNTYFLNFIQMNSQRVLKSLLLFTLFSLMFFGCASGGDAGKGKAGSAAVEERSEPVRVMLVSSSDISRSVTYTANLQAFREVHLVPATPGRISKIYVEPGKRVSEGQLLVEMDLTQLKQAQVQLKSIETDYRRIDTLRRVGSASQQQYDQIRTQYDLAKSNVAFLEENTRLLAPFSGTVSGKYFENGEMFSGAPNTVAGKAAIISLVQTNRLKAILNVAERYYPQIKVGMAVSILSDMYPNEAFSATVTTIYPVIDQATRSFKIELSVPNSSEMLRPGMFARASLDLDQVEAFVVPSLAVMKVQGSNERFVFLEEHGKARRIIVEIGDRYDDMVELVSDEIEAGDKLIIAGQSRLVDGVAVSIIQ